jgi:hypothetical protein
MSAAASPEVARFLDGFRHFGAAPGRDTYLALFHLRIELGAIAGDDALVFLEWKASGRIGECTVSFGFAERFDLAAGLGLAGRVYLDTLALAAVREVGSRA